MDIEALAARYGGVSRAVVTRAKENQRRTAARAPAATGADLASPVASLVVAGRALDEPLDAKRLAQLAGVGARAVDSSVQRMLVVVGAAQVVRTTPAALCIRFGCEAIAEIVGRVFAEYQSASRQRKPPRRGGGANGGSSGDADPKEPVFVAACLFACSKQANLRVDRAKLLEFVCGYPKEFDAMVSSIEATCKATLSGVIASKRKGRAAVSARASGAAVADAIDAAARPQPVSVTPSRAASSAHPLTPSPRRVSPRWLGRAAGSSSPSSRLASPSSGRSPRARRTLAMPSVDEYAAWRAAALAHMRRKRSEQRLSDGEPVEKKAKAMGDDAPAAVEASA